MTTPGQRLYDKGWRQGSRIASSVPQAHFAPLDEAVKELPMPAEMDLVLTTQACDLVKPNEKLPFLEAIGCLDDPAKATSVRANDSRYFVLDPATGTIADRAFGAHLTREALEAFPAPDPPCGGSLVRAQRFATWLGARYDRPALPTAAVEALQRPLTTAIRRLCGPGRRHEKLNHDLHEVRVIGDLEAGPPFTIDLLIFLVTETASVEASELAVAEVLETAGYAIDGFDGASSEGAVVVTRWLVARPSQLPVALYHQATPIPLAYESVHGDELIGAEPLDAESA